MSGFLAARLGDPQRRVHARADLAELLLGLPFDAPSYARVARLRGLADVLLAQCEAPAAVAWLEDMLATSFDWRLRGDARNAQIRTLADTARWDALTAAMQTYLDELAVAATALEERPEDFDARARLDHERARYHELRAVQRLDLGVLDLVAEDLRAIEDVERELEGLLATGASDARATAAIPAIQADVRRIHASIQIQHRLLAARFEEASAEARAQVSEAQAADPRPFLLMAGLAEAERARLGNEGSAPRARDLLEQVLRLSEPEQRGPFECKATIALAELSLLQARDGAGDAAAKKAAWDRAGRELRAAGPLARGGCVDVIDAAHFAALEALFALQHASDAGELSAARDRAVQALAALLADWAAAPAPRGGIGFLHASFRRMLLVATMRLELALDPASSGDGARRALEHLLRSQANGSLLASPTFDPDRAFDFERFQREALRPDRGVLFLLPDKYGTLVLAVDGTGPPLARTTAGDDDLVPPLAALRDALQAPFRVQDEAALARERALRAARARAAAIEVRERLLPADIRAELRTWKAVTIVGSEYLDGIPVEAWPLDEKGERPLGLELAVDVVPSLPAQEQLRLRARREAAKRDRFAGLAVLCVPELLETEMEAWREPVASALRVGRADVRVLRDEHATPSALLAAYAESGPLDYLHLLVHGRYAFGKERGASLVLAADGASGEAVIDSDWLEAHALRARLVVLSACRGALGPARLGDDNLAHLGGAELALGAECVVLSRAELELGETATLLRAFHAALVDGASPAEALRKGRAAAAEADPTGWAAWGTCGMQAFGHGQAPLASLAREGAGK